MSRRIIKWSIGMPLFLLVTMALIFAVVVYTPLLSYRKTYIDVHTGRLKTVEVMAGTGWVFDETIQETSFSRLAQRWARPEQEEWRLAVGSGRLFFRSISITGTYSGAQTCLEGVALWGSDGEAPSQQMSEYVKLALLLLEEGRLEELQDLSNGPDVSDVWNDRIRSR